MKTIQITLTVILFSCLTFSVSAQEKTEKFKVNGNCGMCKNKIEKAAKAAGATYANWDEDTKQLEVKYSSTSTNSAKIQEKIAETGYDNAGAKATDEAYNKLHGCCKYDREAASDCCKDGVCSEAEAKGCCVDGKCTNASDDCCEGGKCSKKDHKKKSKSKSTAKKA